MATRTRRPERRQEPLSHEHIVSAAVELLDAVGERGLTFRALAERLETGPGAIYWHVTGKTELLGAATETVIATIADDDTDATPQEAYLEAFGRLHAQGKFRVLGVSNFDAARLKSAIDLAAQADLPRVQVLQPEYNLVSRAKFEGGLQDLCVREGIGALPYYGLASGFLTGKYRGPADLGRSVRGARMADLLDGRGRAVLDAIHAPRAAAVIEAFGLPDEPTHAWTVDGTTIDEGEVREAHLRWYAEHPDAVAAGLERHGETLALLGLG